MFEVGKNYKIDLSGYELAERREISEKIQRRLFALGYKWYLNGDKIVRFIDKDFLFIDSDMDITWGTKEHGHRDTPLLPSDILAPQRGDVVDVSDDGSDWYERIFLCEIDGAVPPYIFVAGSFEEEFKNGEQFAITFWKHMRPITKKKYRDFTPSELVEQVGKDFLLHGRLCTVREVWFCEGGVSIKIDGYNWTIGYNHEKLTFPDGSPFGVEVTE